MFVFSLSWYFYPYDVDAGGMLQNLATSVPGILKHDLSHSSLLIKFSSTQVDAPQSSLINDAWSAIASCYGVKRPLYSSPMAMPRDK